MKPRAPLLQRVGVRYFARRSARVAPHPMLDAVHELNPYERSELLRVERGTIARSAFAGALSGGIAATAELVAKASMPPGPRTWLFLGGITALAATLELCFIYWDTLSSVHELARVAGLELFGSNRSASEDALVEALARAAFELPNPIDGPHGISARRDASRYRLLLATLAYKTKVGVTNFVVKALVRRMLGRVLVRRVLAMVVPFVSVPVTAAWNGIVTWRVLREARLRAMGPSAAEELVELAFAEAPQLSLEGRRSALRAVASAIVRTQDLHPNLVALLERVRARVGDVGPDELDDVGLFLSTLQHLTPTEVRVSLQVLAMACIVDGRLSARERRLWRDASGAAGKSLHLVQLEQLRSSFVRGDGLDAEALRNIGA